MIISIILPMYNVEQYIERCLITCIHQSGVELGVDYEIICINDGSPDRSAQIVRPYVEKYKGISVVDQKNQGLSGARNTGLKHAKGEYVWFVDSDDWIEENCLLRIIDKCKTHNLDILRICAADVINGESIKRYSIRDDDYVYAGIEELKKGIFSVCVPFSIYRRDFLDTYSLSFFPGIYHEDTEFTPRAYYYAKRVGALNEVVYYVYPSPNSITRSSNVQKSLDLIIVMKSLEDFSRKIEKKYRPIIYSAIGRALNSAIYQALSLTKEEQCRVERELDRNKFLFKKLIKSDKVAYRIEGLFLLFNKNPIFIYKKLKNLQFRVNGGLKQITN